MRNEVQLSQTKKPSQKKGPAAVCQSITQQAIGSASVQQTTLLDVTTPLILRVSHCLPVCRLDTHGDAKVQKRDMP